MNNNIYQCPKCQNVLEFSYINKKDISGTGIEMGSNHIISMICKSCNFKGLESEFRIAEDSNVTNKKIKNQYDKIDKAVSLFSIQVKNLIEQVPDSLTKYITFYDNLKDLKQFIDVQLMEVGHLKDLKQFIDVQLMEVDHLDKDF